MMICPGAQRYSYGQTGSAIPKTYSEIKKEYERLAESDAAFWKMLKECKEGPVKVEPYIDVNAVIADGERLHALRQALAKASIDLILDSLNVEE